MEMVGSRLIFLDLKVLKILRLLHPSEYVSLSLNNSECGSNPRDNALHCVGSTSAIFDNKIIKDCSCEICVSQISTSLSSSVELSAVAHRNAITLSHPLAFSLSATPTEYASSFKRLDDLVHPAIFSCQFPDTPVFTGLFLNFSGI